MQRKESIPSTSTAVILNAKTGRSNLNLSQIVLPPINAKVGRPKGAGKTVFGKKKVIRSQDSYASNSKDDTYFEKMPKKDKMTRILGWIKKRPIHGQQLIEIDDMNLPNKIIQRLSNTDMFPIKIVRSFFSAEAYEKIENLIEDFIKTDNWRCSECENVLEGENVLCECCLDWFHCTCVNFKNEENFVCLKCKI